MSAPELNALMAAAEQAAASDDYTSAERMLREAATVQERNLGPDHPDLANTFNNLGVVCERAGKPDDAEACYRRAYAIATNAFAPDHPFVATSRKNLEDLCQQLARPFDLPVAEAEQIATPQQVVAAPEPAQAAHSPEQRDKPQARDATPREQGPASAAPPLRLQFDSAAAPVKPVPAAVPVPPGVTKKRDATQARSRALPVGAAIVVGISLVLVLIGWIAWPSGPSREPDQSVVAETKPEPTTPPAPEPAAAAPSRVEPAASPDRSATKSAPERATSAPSKSASPTAAASTPNALTLNDARLCERLSTSGPWQCDPIASPVTSGTIYFYTRIVSPRATTVQHRWYQGDQLRQSVMLDIQANPSGYRTFSRTTVGPNRAGAWRVELRTADGRVLHEDRFTVR